VVQARLGLLEHPFQNALATAQARQRVGGQPVQRDGTRRRAFRGHEQRCVAAADGLRHGLQDQPQRGLARLAGHQLLRGHRQRLQVLQPAAQLVVLVPQVGPLGAEP
jgi:hypothetical protein